MWVNLKSMLASLLTLILVGTGILTVIWVAPIFAVLIVGATTFIMYKLLLTKSTKL